MPFLNRACKRLYKDIVLAVDQANANLNELRKWERNLYIIGCLSGSDVDEIRTVLQHRGIGQVRGGESARGGAAREAGGGIAEQFCYLSEATRCVSTYRSH